MTHFAKVENGIVTNVIRADEQYIATLPDASLWMQTSYHTRGGVYYESDGLTPAADQSQAFRKNYAGVGFTYDSQLDAFIPPKPFNSWLFNTQTCQWDPPEPEPAPTETTYYVWDEFTVSWRDIRAQWTTVESPE